MQKDASYRMHPFLWKAGSISLLAVALFFRLIIKPVEISFGTTRFTIG